MTKANKLRAGPSVKAAVAYFRICIALSVKAGDRTVLSEC